MVLAPMADVTDMAFRYIIAKYSKYGGQDIGPYGKFTRPHSKIVGGPDVLWTEFVSADGLFLGGYDHLIHDLKFTEAEHPIVAQFFTSKPEIMKKAAELAVKLGFDGIDINMGCPDKSIEKQGAGAASMKNPKLAQEVILAAKEGAKKDGKNLPISVKTRVGYNKNELETWLPALLETNPAVITIHARTRKEMSNVPARWEHVKRAVEIRDEMKKETLIFGNGDVSDIEDARKKVLETGADGVMLGRAIFGNPWLFANLSQAKHGRQVERSAEALAKGDIPIAERLRVLVEHTKLFEKLLMSKLPLGPGKSFAVMKKHFKAYVAGWPARHAKQGIAGVDGAKELRMQLMKTENAGDVEKVITDYLKMA